MTRISLTPIIDVVFILLIFFMLASNFNKVGELNMDLSKESSQSSNEDIKLIKLIVKQDNTVMSNGKIYDENSIWIVEACSLDEARSIATKHFANVSGFNIRNIKKVWSY